MRLILAVNKIYIFLLFDAKIINIFKKYVVMQRLQ